MINKINTTNWQSFNLSDLFKIKGSKTTPILELQEYGIGKNPFVTTQATNNGVEGFYNFSTEKGGVLIIDSAVLGYCSYQDTDFSASDHVEKLIPKFEMTKNIAMFLLTIINREQYRYNYGRKASQERLKSCSIKLPIKNGKPDWNFMEKFIGEHTHNYQYAKKPNKNLATPQLNINKWKIYKLSDLFNIETGKDLLYYSSLIGKNPVIGHSAINNGVVAHTSELPNYKLYNHENSLTLADRGNFFATTQPQNYYLGTRTKALIAKFDNVNTAILLFIATIINKEKYRFNYGRVASKRTGDIKIKLPTKNGKPDWNFMTNFIQTLPFSSQI